MERRAFLAWVGVGWVASCLPIAIAACANTNTDVAQSSTSANSRRKDGFEAVGTIAELDKSGQLLAKNFVGGAILVVRDPANRDQLMAVNPICTHQGCAVEWKGDRKAFVCPCHRAKFSVDGQVLAGPATRPLKTFTAKVEDNKVLVKV